MSALLLLAVVDDNTGYLLRRYAGKCGLRTRRVSQPELVMHLAQDLAPVAIIVEIGGTGEWGKDLLAWLKTDAITSQIPIVLYGWLMHTGDAYADQVDATLHHPLLYEDFLLSMEAIGVLPPRAGLGQTSLGRR